MTTVDDIIARMKSALPVRWFGIGDTPNLDALLASGATNFQAASSLFDDVKLQTRILTATGANLDLVARDFFGRRVQRRTNESDDVFRLRIIAEIFRERATLNGLKRALYDLTGFWPDVWEPERPYNACGYGAAGGGGYGIAGCYASLQYPGEIWIKAYRPLSVHALPNLNGYGGYLGGYGVGSIAYVSIKDSGGILANEQILDTVRRTKAAGIKAWVAILGGRAATAVQLRSAFIASGDATAPELTITSEGTSLWIAEGNVAGDVDVERPLTSTATVAGNISGDIEVRVGIFSSASAEGNVAGNVEVERSLISTATAAGNIAVTVEVSNILASTATAAGNVAGDIDVGITAAVSAASDVSATLTCRRTVTEFASATSSDATITAPANINAGDIIVLEDRATNISTIPTSVVPTGFTSISNLGWTAASVGIRSVLSYKVADGTEGGSTITGMSGNANTQKMLYVFRPNRAPSSVSVGSMHEEYTESAPADQVVTTGSSDVPAIVLAAYGSSGTISPRGFTPAKDGEINSGTSAYLAYKIYNGSPADVTISMEDEGSRNSVQSCYLLVS